MKKETKFLLGMPQLALGGLSEIWLLKECGNIHWQILTTIFGKKSSEFCDNSGNRIYPAFRAVEISNANLGMVSEDDELTIKSEVQKISNTQVYSKHVAKIGRNQIATVEMISIFLARRIETENRSVVRVRLDTDVRHVISPGMYSLLEKAKSIDTTHEIPNPKYQNLENDTNICVEFLPCPSIHFNGAKFMYFAMFHTFVDQIEWDAINKISPRILQTEHREIYYYGNINAGDSIKVKCFKLEVTDFKIKHWCKIVREDAVEIADIFTTKKIG